MSKKRIVGGAAALLLLLVFYLLCRFGPLSAHGMKQWPDFLACVGAAVIILATLLKLRLTPFAAALGYVVGFVAGSVFQSDGVDPGGGVTNNLWIIWTVVYFAIIIAGLAWDIIKNRRRV